MGSVTGDIKNITNQPEFQICKMLFNSHKITDNFPVSSQENIDPNPQQINCYPRGTPTSLDAIIII